MTRRDRPNVVVGPFVGISDFYAEIIEFQGNKALAGPYCVVQRAVGCSRFGSITLCSRSKSENRVRDTKRPSRPEFV